MLEGLNELKVYRQLIKSEGPWPFVTKRIFRLANGETRLWQSRHHRKGFANDALIGIEAFGKSFLQGLLMPSKMNWWIGIVFALGSFLFMVGSILSIWPAITQYLTLSLTEVNTIFFMGSIPFTTAAFLQVYQATLAIRKLNHLNSNTDTQNIKTSYLTSVGWLSAALQFVGTLLFNVSTYDGIMTNMDWSQTDLLVWVPDILGSILFLASGYLAFIEVSHAYWSWQTKNMSWWVVFVNLLGCIAFMVSALFVFVIPTPLPLVFNLLSLIFTLVGAFCFFVGSWLMIPEMAMGQKTQ